MTIYKTATLPDDIPNLFVHYWNDRNADGIASLFTQDAEFINVVGLWWHNREDIRKAHDYGLKVIFNASDLKLTRVKVKNLNDKVAVVNARMHLQGQSALGQVDKPQVRQTIFTFIAQQVGEKWLCAAAHNTDIVPGKETNIIDEKGVLRSVDYRKK